MFYLSDKKPDMGNEMNWPMLFSVPTIVSFHLFFLQKMLNCVWQKKKKVKTLIQCCYNRYLINTNMVRG